MTDNERRGWLPHTLHQTSLTHLSYVRNRTINGSEQLWNTANGGIAKSALERSIRPIASLLRRSDLAAFGAEAAIARPSQTSPFRDRDALVIAA